MKTSHTHSDSTSCSEPRRAHALAHRSAFTLVELIVVVAIIAVVSALSTMSWKAATSGSVRSLAINTLTTYISVARAYALSNQVETMLVVNPYDGRLELWRANPPGGQQRNPPWDPNITTMGNHPDDWLNGTDHTPVGSPQAQFPIGGTWDISSTGDPTGGLPADGNAGCRLIDQAFACSYQRNTANGYVFVPYLDASARLPIDSNGRLRAFVAPIDYENRHPTTGQLPNDPTGNVRAALDNLIWTSFCFAPDGHMVSRARRIDLNSRDDPTKRADYQPLTVSAGVGGSYWYSVDAARDPQYGMFDTLLLSSPGFVVVEEQAFAGETGFSYFDWVAEWIVARRGGARPDIDAAALVNFLQRTVPGNTVAGVDRSKFAEHVLLNAWSGRIIQIKNKIK